MVSKGKPILELENVTYRPSETVRDLFSGFTLQIREGEFLALLGPSGAGKSTLALLMRGLRKPQAGKVFFRGRDIFALAPEERLAIGLVMQNPESQRLGITVEEDVAFGLRCRGIQERKAVEEALATVGLLGMEKTPVIQLSGGQKQCLSLAAILALKPEVLVLDEPATMLDPLARRNFVRLISHLHRQGRTVVYITHSLEEVEAAERAVVLVTGKIVFDGPMAELRRVVLSYYREWGLRLPFSWQVEALLRKKNFFPLSWLEEKIKKEKGAIAQKRKTPLTTPVITAEKVGYSYYSGTPFVREALKEVTTTVNKGDRVALIGPMAAGKSTFLQLVKALLLPTQGKLEVAGKNPAVKRERREIMGLTGLVFQYPEEQFAGATVAEELRIGLKTRRLPKEKEEEKVKEAAILAGLADKLTTPVRCLSGGERRKLALAGVLMLEPEILLLDEPLVGLDGRGLEVFLALLIEAGRHGRTTLVTLHDLEYLPLLAEKILLFHQGRVSGPFSLEELVGGQEQLLREIGLELPLNLRLWGYLKSRGYHLHPWAGAEEMVEAFCREVKGGEER